MKYSLLSFWEGFCYDNNSFTKNFLKEHSYTSDYNNCDFIIFNCFINQNEYALVMNLQCKKFLYITEPIESYKHYKNVYYLYENNYFNGIIGCIDNNIEKMHFKLPLYINYIPDIDLLKNNNPIFVRNNLINKEFCCLINTHDDNNTRTPMYNLLKNLGHITCPSRLFNNCSNEELNSIGNIKFINKFKFNICSENSISNIPGYITEKLLNCCLGGAIPIYYGSFDEIDEKIFNKNRILFYDGNREESLNNTYLKVKELLENEDKFIEFYSQKTFQDDAVDIINELIKNINNINLFL